MTAYHPLLSVAPKPVVPTGPKLSYELGELCWVFAGLRGVTGGHIFSPGKVVFWFDLVDMAQRFYVIRILSKDFMHFMTRTADVMSPTPDPNGFPFLRTEKDEHDRSTDKPVQWRQS